jgi:sphinganine-1-phosphate aldolase
MHDWFIGCFTTYLQELGELASRYDICLHIDLCLGGFVLPFARKLGYELSS